MSGQDRIEIEQDARTLRGAGSLRVSLATVDPSGRPALPYVDGVVTFDERVAFSALEAINGAELRVELASGTRHTFRQAVVMDQEADAQRPNTYALRMDCNEVVD